MSDAHIWRELRELTIGDVFSFAIDGETYMVLDRNIDGIYRIVDHYFHKHTALGCTPVYFKEKRHANGAQSWPMPARRASDPQPMGTV